MHNTAMTLVLFQQDTLQLSDIAHVIFVCLCFIHDVQFYSTSLCVQCYVHLVFRFFHFETTVNLITEQKQCDNKLDRSCTRFLCSRSVVVIFCFLLLWFLCAIYCVLKSHFGFCLTLWKTNQKTVLSFSGFSFVLIFLPTIYFHFNNRNQILRDDNCSMHF